MDVVRNDPLHFKVFEVIGLGGAGKTRFLNELRRRVEDSDSLGYLIWVVLESEASVTETGPLRAIREQLKFECLLFDVALLSYWSSTGQPFSLEHSGVMARSLAFRALELGGGLAGIPVPMTFAVDLFHSLSRRIARIRHYNKEEFEEIDALRLDPGGIRARLPHYLALDIERRFSTANRSIVVFYDSYDKQAPATIAGNSRWLREFIGTLNRGLHVIGTREPIRWSGSDWGDIVQTIVVDELPEPEAKELIRSRLGPIAPEIEDRLIQASGRLPFFLEAAIDSYRSHLAEGDQFGPSDLPANPVLLIAYLLDHLLESERDLLIAMAAVQVFDEGLFLYLVRALNLPISLLHFERFIASFFVEPIPPGLFKVHDLLSDFVRSSVEYAAAIQRSLEGSTEYVLARTLEEGPTNPDRLLTLFHAVVAGWSTTREVPLQSVERIIDAGYRLYDAGYWAELPVIDRGVGTDRSHPSAVICDFFSALAARRSSGVGHALRLFESLEPRLYVLGRHQRSAELELAYLSELSGNYPRARQEFEILDQMASPFDPAQRSHVRARLYHGDMMVMDGQFLRGSRLLFDTYEQVGRSVPLDWAELVRHRAHAFRFSYLFTQAEALYLQSLQASARAPALIAKIQTNLAETYCWYAPERALDAAALSIELNLQIGNHLELAKCDAARGIAFAQLKEFSAARTLTDTAASRADQVGYPAGIAFALQARAIIEGLADDRNAFDLAVSKLTRQLDNLGTYGHLRVSPAWLAGDAIAFAQSASNVDWIDPDGIQERLQACFRTATN